MRRTRLQQTAHVAYEVGVYLIALPSRMVNAVFYGGSIHQSLSARSHIEARTSEEWRRRAARINRLFPWQEDHCARAWAGELDRAMKTVARNSAT